MTIRPDDLTPTVAPPDPNPTKPKFKLPPLACDSHFHVFGPHSKFPYAPDRPFTPGEASPVKFTTPREQPLGAYCGRPRAYPRSLPPAC